MSYEIVDDNKVACPCGCGFVRRIIKENDWFQQKENLVIECEFCNDAYAIVREEHKSKPYHESVFYYLVEKGNEDGQRISVSFV